MPMAGIPAFASTYIYDLYLSQTRPVEHFDQMLRAVLFRPTEVFHSRLQPSSDLWVLSEIREERQFRLHGDIVCRLVRPLTPVVLRCHLGHLQRRRRRGFGLEENGLGEYRVFGNFRRQWGVCEHMRRRLFENAVCDSHRDDLAELVLGNLCGFGQRGVGDGSVQRDVSRDFEVHDPAETGEVFDLARDRGSVSAHLMT